MASQQPQNRPPLPFWSRTWRPLKILPPKGEKTCSDDRYATKQNFSQSIALPPRYLSRTKWYRKLRQTIYPTTFCMAGNTGSFELQEVHKAALIWDYGQRASVSQSVPVYRLAFTLPHSVWQVIQVQLQEVHNAALIWDYGQRTSVSHSVPVYRLAFTHTKWYQSISLFCS